mmetsp:Transcript_75308/g.201142  ORF Transcript_75308/g.201142 Transcript_75308/m.201142 type:complete len:431 (+) Transcript_75308:747-2039(+)
MLLVWSLALPSGGVSSRLLSVRVSAAPCCGLTLHVPCPKPMWWEVVGMGCCVSALKVPNFGVNSSGERFDDKYDLGPLLGRGTYGIVKEARSVSDRSQFFAAKIVARELDTADPHKLKRKRLQELVQRSKMQLAAHEQAILKSQIQQLRAELRHLTSRMTEEDVRQEVAIMQECRHERILELHDFFVSNVHFVLILTMCYGSFESMKPRSGWDDEDVPREHFRDLCRALEFVHSKRILHRDVKPQNMMLQADGSAVLCDMGLAARLGDGQLRTVDVAGTPVFLPPDAYVLGQATSSDMWAAGVTVYWLLFDKIPPFRFDGENQSASAHRSSRRTFGGRRAKLAASIASALRSVSQSLTGTKLGHATSGHMAAQQISEALDRAFVDRCRPGRPARSVKALSLVQSLLCIDHDRRPAATECLRDAWISGAVD